MQVMFSDVPKFLAALKVVAAHASKDETRPHLNEVHVAVHPTSVDFVATDGHRLALYRFPSLAYECVSSLGQATAELSLDRVEHFIKCAKACKSPRIVTIDTAVGTIAVGDVTLKFETDPEAVPTFPPYGQVIPGEVRTDRALPPVSASYVAEAAKAFASLNKYSCGLSMVATEGDYGPIVMRSSAVRELLIVVMPMRDDAVHVSPQAIFADLARLPGDFTPPVPAADAAAQ